MLEATIEHYFVTQVHRLGGLAEKTAAIGARGYFDRVAVLPGGMVLFVELKRPHKGKLSANQSKRHDRYRALGARVLVLWTKLDVDVALDEIMTTAP